MDIDNMAANGPVGGLEVSTLRTRQRQHLWLML